MLSNEYNFIKTSAISNDPSIYRLKYNKDIDTTIQKILNTTNENELLKLFYKITDNCKNIQKTDNNILLAFIKTQLLPNFVMIDILKKHGNILCVSVLTIPFEDKCLPVLKYAVEMVDTLPLSLMEKYIDINKIQNQAIDLLMPDYCDEIMLFDKHFFFFERTSRNDIIRDLIEKEKLSPVLLHTVCSNENLSDEVREMAFEQLDSITTVYCGTDKMKETIFESCAETLFFQHTDEIPIEYLETADKYMQDATTHPSLLLNKKLELDLVIRWGKKDPTHYNQYIENLINNTEYAMTLDVICNTSQNVRLSTLSMIKADDERIMSLFDATAKRIASNVKNDIPIDELDMWIFTQIMNYKSKHKLINNTCLENFISYFNDIGEHHNITLRPLVSIASNIFIKDYIIEDIQKHSKHKVVKDFANLNLTLRKTSLSQEEQFQIIEAMQLLIFTSEEWKKYFNEKQLITPLCTMVVSDSVSEKEGAFSFTNVTLSDYHKIKKALNNLLQYSYGIGNFKTEFGIKIINSQLYNTMIDNQKDKFKNPEMKSDTKMIEILSDLYNQIMLCNNTVDFYDFSHKHSKTFVKLYNKIQERVLGGYIIDTMLPHHLQKVFFRHT